MLTINGAFGEGGGQVLRTSLTLAAILKQPIRIENMRAGRNPPGLAAQHLAAVRAAAMICDARLVGDHLGSTQLTFEPQSAPEAGFYEFDVAEARAGGSAGSTILVLQTVLLPLVLAPADSTVVVKGGTHLPWSPSFHYFNDVYLPALARLGIQAAAELMAWGWYPAGNGQVDLAIGGQTRFPDALAGQPLAQERGALQQIAGVAVAANLPAHIAQRMADRAMSLLRQAGLPAAIQPQRVRSVSPGAGIFLVAEYERSRAGFSALGQPGKPSEQVAEEAVNDLLAFHQSGALLDRHLADQLVLPMALARLPGEFRVEELSPHTLTNLWVVEQFLGRVAEVDRDRSVIRFTPQRTND